MRIERKFGFSQLRYAQKQCNVRRPSGLGVIKKAENTLKGWPQMMMLRNKNAQCTYVRDITCY